MYPVISSPGYDLTAIRGRMVSGQHLATHAQQE
jgi:hypothetical protein